jgi:Rha family phage regulatory protein
MTDVIIPTQEQQSMSSREIANLTGKRHDNVVRDIRGMLEELEIPQLKFEAGYFDAQGQERTGFNLPKRETIILTAGYSTTQRASIVDRWMELEPAFETRPVLTEMENVVDTLKAFLEIGELLGTGVEMSRAVAVKEVQKETGRNLLPFLSHNNVDEVPLTPTMLGEKIGLSASATNIKLRDLGLQVQRKKIWVPTQAGMKYCVMQPYQSENSEHSGHRPMWFASKITNLLGVDPQ